MKKQELLGEALLRRPAEDAPYLERAFDSVVKSDGPYTAQVLADVIEEAGRLRDGEKKEQGQLTEIYRDEGGPLEKIIAERICSRLGPQALSLRKRLLGQERQLPPQEAVEWLERQETIESKTVSAKDRAVPILQRYRKEKDKEKEKEMKKRRKKEFFARTLTPRVIYAPGGAKAETGSLQASQTEFLEYPLTKPDQTLVLHVRSGTPLFELALWVGRVAKENGFRIADVACWVLTGQTPPLPKYRVIKHLRESELLSSCTLEFRQLSFRELLEAYGRIPSLKQRRVKKINRWHWRIYELVEEKGGIPGHGKKTAFWEEIRCQIIAEGHPRPPATWQAIRDAYLGVMKVRQAIKKG